MSRLLVRTIKNCSISRQLNACVNVWNGSNIIQERYFSHTLNSKIGTPWQTMENLKQQIVKRLSLRDHQITDLKKIHTSLPNNSDDVNITYIDREGESHLIKGKVGDNVMYLAQRYDLDVEGACEASLACCTCHVYVEKFFDKLSELEEEEEDMLDLAPFLQENSRLSCQIILNKEIDGIVVRLPSATRNFYVDGHKPKPH